MNNHIVKILSVEPVTHNVKQFRLEKPPGYNFTPGQAADVSVNTPEMKDEKRSFTFTSLTGKDYLEFTIKIYTDHDGVTKSLGQLSPGDELVLGDVWGAIHYKGKGVFIAGGAGVTPFIAILRDLNKKGSLKGNKLIFSNKTTDDIILKDEFEKILGSDFINVISEEKTDKYIHGHITKDIIKSYITDPEDHYYICGPEPMITAIESALRELGINDKYIVKEDLS